MEVYRERYSGRTSGLTRMVPVGSRKGDGAELVELSLVEGKDVPTIEKEPKTKNPSTMLRTGQKPKTSPQDS